MPEDRATRIGDSLGKKIGPLPAGIWLGAIAVGAYLYQRRKGGGAGLPVTAPPATLNYYTTTGGSVTYDEPPDPSGDRPRHPRPGPGPTPVPPVPSPSADSPEYPGGGPVGVPVPDVGAVGAVLRLPARALGFARRNSGGGPTGAIAGMRATSRRAGLRVPLRAAQRATDDAPGLVGLAALEEAPAGRGRSKMPPAPALRQRPAPPRVMDQEKQRNVKLNA